MNYYQINFTDIPVPFIQEEGTVYWLALHAATFNTQQQLGWKTSQDHWNDDAVFYYASERNTYGWWDLIDPNLPHDSLDLAFVITPEPATMALLVVGGLALLRRRRK